MDFSLHLTQVLQFYSATLVHLFVSYLWPIGSVPIFILRDFTIKSLYIERENQTITTPQNMSQTFIHTSYFAHTTS